MRGLGRNVRFMMGRFHKNLIQTGGIFLIVFILMNIGMADFITRIKESAPFYYFILMAILMLCAIGFGESYFPTMISVGSGRKPSAIGMLLSMHIFMVEQLVILFGLAAFIDNSKSMQVVRICPLGTIAVVALLIGIGNLLNAVSIEGHKIFAGIAGFVLGFSVVVLALVMMIMCDFEINVEVFSTYNNWLFLLAGLALDLLGAFLYYKVVTRVDLKLA